MKKNQISPSKKELGYAFSLYKNEQFQKAIDEIKKINNEYPNQPLLFNLIGACYKELGELAGAAKMFEIAISLSPKYSEAHFNLGVIFQALEKNEDAIRSYREAISIKPNYPDAHNNLGNLFIDIGKFDDAIESLEWAVAFQHDFAEAYNNLGNALNAAGNEVEAIVNFKKAISHNPNYANALFNLALVYKDLGDKKGFNKYIKLALILRPNWGAAHFHLSQLNKFKKNDPRIPEMLTILRQKKLYLTDRINLNFALAKAYEDSKDFDNQFTYLNEANSLRKKELNYTIDRDNKLFSRIKEAFNPPPYILENSIIKKPSKVPIFIVGMPRSGTSLVHQILDTHHRVRGLGELNYLNKSVFPAISINNNLDKSGFSETDLRTVRDNYLNSISSLKCKEKYIVDKMPLNFRYAGFILSAMPEAKIIHTTRNPMATCWSIYKYFFNGNAYSFDQSDLADYYHLYRDIMKLWDRLFPDKIHELNYENLTVNQKLETQKLLNYCDLDWDESCLSFHTNKTAIKTTSSIQVRKKMYQGSSEVWRQYEAYLQPLIKGLSEF